MERDRRGSIPFLTPFSIFLRWVGFVNPETPETFGLHLPFSGRIRAPHPLDRLSDGPKISLLHCLNTDNE